MNICACTRQAQSGCNVSELSDNRTDKGLHNVFIDAVNELHNKLPVLGESGSEVSHLIPEPRTFSEVTRLLADVKIYWLKSDLKDIKYDQNQTFLMDYPEKGGPVTPCMDVYKSKIKHDGSIDML